MISRRQSSFSQSLQIPCSVECEGSAELCYSGQPVSRLSSHSKITIVVIHRESKSDATLSILVPVVNDGLVWESLKVGQSLMHLSTVSFEEASTSSLEQSVASEDTLL